MNKAVRSTLHYLPFWLLLALLSACGGGNNDDNEGQTLEDVGQDSRVANMRFVNAIPDSPLLDMQHSGDRSQLFSEQLNFGESSNLKNFVIGDFVFNFGFFVAGQRTVLFEAEDVPLSDGDEFTYLMLGTLDDPQVLRIDNTEFLLGQPEGTVLEPEIQFVHTVVGQGSLDFYLTPQAADISAAAPDATLAFGEHSALLPRAESEDYRLRVFAAGDTATPLFDSGATSLVNTTRTLYVALNYFGPGGGVLEVRPLGVVPLAFAEPDLPTELVVHNLLADVAAVDVFQESVLGAPIVDAVPAGVRTAPQAISDGTQTVLATADGDGTILFESTQALIPGNRVTLYLGGLATDAANDEAPTVSGLLVAESDRRISGLVALRVFHAAASAGTIDVYLLPPGASIETSSPTASSLSLGSYGQANLAPGDYDLAIVDQANGAVLIGPERVALEAGNIATLLVEDAPGGGIPVTAGLSQSAAIAAP